MTPLVLSCEHATNRVPADLATAFRGAGAALRSHRAWDPGALELARELARRLGAPLVAARCSRLVVDANRSAHHPRVLSEWTRRLPPERRERILAAHWAPHREQVERLVREARAEGGPVLHVSVHSFTPRLAGRARRADVALLYDPARARERDLADRWLGALAARRPDLRLRRNYPYRGTSDGLTTALRRAFPAAGYLGVELEVSQRFPRGPERAWRRLRADVAAALRDALA